MATNDLLPGVDFPAHGLPLYVEDWQHEQEEKSQAVVDRDLDLFGFGIVKGGGVAAGASANTIDLTEETVAYDEDGHRIFISPAPTGIAVPADTTSKIVLRHKFTETDNVAPESSTDPIVWRADDYEILARTGSLFAGDVPLFEVSAASGVVTIGTDLRSKKTLEGENIKEDTLETVHLKDGIVIDSETRNKPEGGRFVPSPGPPATGGGLTECQIVL